MTAAAKAAKKEAEGTGPVFTIETGETFRLPARLTYGIVRLADKDPDLTLQKLLGDQFEMFCDTADVNDAVALLSGVAEMYGTTEGESEASTESSENTTERSRPTSKPTTD